jgi:F420-0:gamma-glutamyl ligase
MIDDIVIMRTYAIKTKRLNPREKFDLNKFVISNLKSVKERSVLGISSKIVSISQGQVVEADSIDKDELIKREAETYYQPEAGKYESIVTINKNILQIASGVDESNADGLYILLPKNPQKVANSLREYISSKLNLKKFGVLIIDSRSTPLRRGVVGVGLAHSGFMSIRNYIGSKDIFGRELKVSQTNMIDSLASLTNLEMGEGSEQTPIVIVEDDSGVIEFNSENPTKDELKYFWFDYEQDLYYDILNNTNWQKK